MPLIHLLGGDSDDLFRAESDAAGLSGEDLALLFSAAGTDDASLSGTDAVLGFSASETDAAGLSGADARSAEYPITEPDEAGLTGARARLAEYPITETDDAALTGADYALNYTEFLLQYLGIAYELFTFTLDGTEIPISTFQARFKDGDPTHLQVTIPDYVTWAATVAAATDGEMVITGTYFYGGETVLTQQILAVDVDSIDFAEGPSSKTITLKGKRTVSTTAQTAALSGTYSKQIQSGTTTYQLATIDYFLRPGDTATIGDDTITVDSITYTVSPGSAHMTVKAA